MTRLIFLFGDQHDNFAETSRPFVEAAGGTDAIIAMITGGGEKARPYVERITSPWREIGVQVLTVGPQEYIGDPDDAMERGLRECSGIFMCGGDTRAYERMYVASSLGDLIRRRYSEGIPYAGVSAGALLAAEECATWGGIVKEQGNEYYVRYRGCYDGVEGDIQLQMGKGLGLLKGLVFEPHFSELGGFPRLVTVMDRTRIREGYGLDEPICLTFEDGSPTQVTGRGRLYRLRRHAQRRFIVDVYEPGEQIQL